MSEYVVEVTYQTKIRAPGVLAAFDEATKEMPRGVNPGIMRILNPKQQIAISKEPEL